MARITESVVKSKQHASFVAQPTRAPRRAVARTTVSLGSPIVSGTLYVGRPTQSSRNGSEDGRGGIVFPASLAARFCIDRELASGPEAELFVVTERDEAEQHVLKLYRPTTGPESAVMEWLGSNPGPHLLQSREYGEAEGQYYELMEYLELGSMRQCLDHGSFREQAWLTVLQQLSESLTRIHTPDAAGTCVVHRDIKPENVLVRQMEPPDLCLSDFSIAVFHPGDQGLALSRFTLAYAAPESLGGSVSPAGDYWSLGMLLMEMVTGRHPFASLEDRHIERQLRGSWPGEGAFSSISNTAWRELIHGLLTRDPEARWDRAQIEGWLTREQAETGAGPATESAVVQPLLVGQESCTTAGQLARALARNWAVGRAHLEAGRLHVWIDEILEGRPLLQRIEEALRRTDDPDIGLLSCIYTIDSTLAAVWKGVSISSEHRGLMAELAIRGDDRAQALLEEIHDRRVLNILADLKGDASLGQFATGWREAANTLHAVLETRHRWQGGGGLPSRATNLAALHRLIDHPGLQGHLRQEVRWAFHALGREELHMPRSLSSAECLGWLLGFRILLHAGWQVGRARMETFCDTTVTWTGFQTQTVHSRGGDPPLVQLDVAFKEVYFRYGDHVAPIGRRVRLVWNVRNSTTVRIRELGRVAAEGHRYLSIGAARGFEIVAHGPGGRTRIIVQPVPVESPHLRVAPSLARIRPVLRRGIPLHWIGLENSRLRPACAKLSDRHRLRLRKAVPLRGESAVCATRLQVGLKMRSVQLGTAPSLRSARPATPSGWKWADWKNIFFNRRNG